MSKLMFESETYKAAMAKITPKHLEDCKKLLKYFNPDASQENRKAYITACGRNLKAYMKRAGLLNKYLPH